MPVSEHAFGELRSDVVALKVARAGSDVNDRNVDRRLTNIERMSGAILLLVIGAIVSGAWEFVAHGGLSNVPH